MCAAKALRKARRDSWSRAMASSVCGAGVVMLGGAGSCQGFTLRVLSEGKNKPENVGCLQVLKHF